MPHRIIVCGIYRSGTSLTTRLVQEWGAYIGRKDDLFEDEFGYLEHIGLQKINDELLNNNSRVPTAVDVLVEKTRDKELRLRAEKVLHGMDAEALEQNLSAWAWKDPRLPLTLPFWFDVCKDAIYVIPVRHPVETILSGAKMEGLTPENTPLSAGLAYWQFCMLNILNFTQNSPRKIFISYDQLIQNPLEECSRLSNFLDQQCEIKTSENDHRADAMAAHVQSNRRHYESPASLADLEVATAEQRALYNFLRVKTIYPAETFRPSDFALYPGWLEYLQVMDMLVPFITPQYNE